MKNESNPTKASQKDSKQQTQSLNGGSENEVERKDGSRAQQQSPMTNGNQFRSTNDSLPKLVRRRDIF